MMSKNLHIKVFKSKIYYNCERYNKQKKNKEYRANNIEKLNREAIASYNKKRHLKKKLLEENK